MIYEFDQFELNQKKRLLLFKGEVIHLQPKSLQILFILVENAGKTVTKEELVSGIWGERLVDENNLPQRIFQLRRTLGDVENAQKKIIATVPGVGYRFELPIRAIREDVSSPSSDQKAALISEEPVAEIHLDRHTSPFRLFSGTSRIALAALLGGIVMVALLTYLIWIQKAGGEKSSGYIAPIATLQGSESFPAFSADGRFIAFSCDGGQIYNTDICVKMTNEGNEVRITSDQAAEQQPAWSPDGHSIAFLRSSKEAGDKFHLIITPALGGAEREVVRVWGGLAWSPDGKWLAVSDNDRRGESTGIYLISIDGKQRQALSRPDPSSNIFDTNPSFSPDGRQLSFVRWISDAAGELFIVDIADGRIRQLTSDQKEIRTPNWSPDGRAIVYVSNRNGNRRVWRIPAGGGSPTLVDHLPTDIEHISIARTGAKLAFTQRVQETTLDIYKATDLQPPPCQINSSRHEGAPQISPDGKSVVFESERSGWNEIWTAGIDCTNLFQVTNFSENTGGSPRWSPDGKQIVFSRFINGQSDICTIDRDGTNYRRLTSNPSADILPAWSIDGKSIYFSSHRTGQNEIYRMPVEGGVETRITFNGGSNGVETFDGSALIYSKNETLHRKDLPNGRESPIAELTGVNVGRGWDLTPNAIFYTPQKKGGPTPLYRFDLRTNKITVIDQIRKQTVPLLPSLSVSSSEDLIAISYLNFHFGDVMMIEGWR
jgi:Tol biopolymer transport system component/DNA-binding winged helix-turn-helix (wHTH) protein